MDDKKQTPRKIWHDVKLALDKELAERNLIRRAKALIRKAQLAVLELKKARDIVKNNYELGTKHYKLGNITDAILRLKMVTWLEPNHAVGWYWLGMSYLAQGSKGNAKKCFATAMKLKPDWSDVKYMYAIASGEAAAITPTSMPTTLAQDHFDGVAKDYTRQQLDVFGYKGDEIISNTLRTLANPPRNNYSILELGTGTGLVALKLRDIAGSITGVDISSSMISQARALKDANGKAVYDRLTEAELHAYLQANPPEEYDIILLASVAGYIGELGPLFAAAKAALKPGGALVITAEILDAPNGFALDTTEGRFRFSESYLKQLAAQNNFAELVFARENIYPDYPMWLCVFGK